MALTEEEKREKNRLRHKKWRDKNPKKIKAKNKKWRDKNPEKAKAYTKKWYEQNTEKAKANTKKWAKENPEKKKESKKKYYDNNYTTDNIFKLAENIRASIRTSIYNSGYQKKSRTQEILGCSFEDFKIHLEKQFESWMNWENKGNPKDGIFELNKTWDIDHIIPISSATSEEEIIKLNHYTNLRPLCSYYNRFVKRHHLEEDLKKDLVDNL